MDDDLRQQLVHGDARQRLIAATRLQQRGSEGADILASLARDQTLEERVRLTALWHLVPTLLEEPDATMLALLADSAPALRYWALKKIGDAMIVNLAAAVAGLTSDDASLHGLDEILVVSDAAREVLARLTSSGGDSGPR